MWEFINESLMKFEKGFSREAPFKWFVVVVVGLMTGTEHFGVTSIIRTMGINPIFYHNLLHFFRASSWNLDKIQEIWMKLVMQSNLVYSVSDMPVLIGDGIKVSKEGRKMPGVKKLRQESGNSAKADYIRGHMFGAIGALIGDGTKYFCTLLSMRLHDGNETVGKWAGDKYADESHVVRMIREGCAIAMLIGCGCILVLDAYFLSADALKLLKELEGKFETSLLTLITKVKTNGVAWEKPEPANGKRGAGRPRVRGAKVKLWDLFASEASAFIKATVTLYGKEEKVEYLIKNFLWSEGDYFELYFVYVKWGTTETILACNNMLLGPEKIIELYGLRFKIECSFREFKQVVAGFAYRFWSFSMPKLKLFAKNEVMCTIVEAINDKKEQKRIVNAYRATERFVMLACIAFGLLQMASLRFGDEINNSGFRWLRTKTANIPSEATTADFARKTINHGFYFSPKLYISRLIKSCQPQHPVAADDAAA